MLPRRDSQSCTLAPAKLKRRGWGGMWKRRPSHCTTLSLLTMRSWTKQQMRSSSLGAGRQAVVVIGHVTGQTLVSRSQVRGPGQTEFADEPILEHAPETFDTTLGLGRVGGDVGDPELLECAAELRGLAAASQLFFDGPVIVVADEDTVAVAVAGQGNAVATQQALEQAEIALGGLGREERGGEDLAGRIVLQAQGGEQRAAAFEPVMRAAVEQDQLPLASRTQAALAMSRSPAFSGRAKALAAEQTTEGFPAEGKALDLGELFAEMVIVEAAIAGAR